MSYRKTPIVVNEIYHVFNQSVAKQPIFISNRDYRRALDVFRFYQYSNPSLRFSFYNRLSISQKEEFFSELILSAEKLVEIICFCLMPNHAHFLLKNLRENGISRFMSNFQNSYAKYFNTRTSRVGSVFRQNFKAVRIESEEQLLHVSRYIHLNPVSSFLIEVKDLETYPWSSYPAYLTQGETWIQKELILAHFKSIEDYKQFILDQVDYQRKLEIIKHLTFE